MQPVISTKLFPEKSQVIIIIRHSSIDETTIAQDLYQDMRGSRNFRRGWGGGGQGPSVIKIPDNVFIVLFLSGTPLILQNANGLFQRKL